MSYLNDNITSRIFYDSIGFEILLIGRTPTDLINMVKRVNLLLMRMKKKRTECNHIISLLKKKFRRHFRVFHRFADIAGLFIELSSL